MIDLALPPTQVICLYLPVHCLLRACLGSTFTHLQPIAHVEALLGRGQAFRRCRFTTRALSLLHEGMPTVSTTCLTNITNQYYQLNSIDNMKKDGKFMVGNDIPEGQGAVIALLAECFDLAYDLRTEAEERSESEAIPEEEVNGVGTKA